jgi:glycosyltransferase involved in cell wall biosynthesis
MTKQNDVQTPDRKPRKVLMICCVFPPAGGAGVQRSVKFAKYLPSFGWLPTVWTATDHPYLPQDPTLLEDLPEEVQIASGGEALNAQTWQRRLRRWRERGGVSGRIAQAVDWRLETHLVRGGFPDMHSQWAKASLRPLLIRLAEEPHDAIYSTFSPASNHWLALRLKRETGLPWIADFRDLWTDDPRYVVDEERRHQARRRLEQQILEEADAVIGVSNGQRDALAEHVPDAQDKFHTITNGFDPEDFERVGDLPPREDSKFIIGYVGRLDRPRTPEGLYAGLDSFLNGLGYDVNRVAMRFVGRLTEEPLARLQALGMPVETVDYLPHLDAIQEMRSSDVQLVITDDELPRSETVISGKLFETLASGTPVIHVGPTNGCAADIMRQAGSCQVVAPNAEELGQALMHVYCAWKAGTPLTGPKPDSLVPFSRPRLTQKLSTLLNIVHAANAGRPATARDREVALT